MFILLKIKNTNTPTQLNLVKSSVKSDPIYFYTNAIDPKVNHLRSRIFDEFTNTQFPKYSDVNSNIVGKNDNTNFIPEIQNEDSILIEESSNILNHLNITGSSFQSDTEFVFNDSLTSLGDLPPNITTSSQPSSPPKPSKRSRPLLTYNSTSNPAFDLSDESSLTGKFSSSFLEMVDVYSNEVKNQVYLEGLSPCRRECAERALEADNIKRNAAYQSKTTNRILIDKINHSNKLRQKPEPENLLDSNTHSCVRSYSTIITKNESLFSTGGDQSIESRVNHSQSNSKGANIGIGKVVCPPQIPPPLYASKALSFKLKNSKNVKEKMTYPVVTPPLDNTCAVTDLIVTINSFQPHTPNDPVPVPLTTSTPKSKHPFIPFLNLSIAQPHSTHPSPYFGTGRRDDSLICGRVLTSRVHKMPQMTSRRRFDSHRDETHSSNETVPTRLIDEAGWVTVHHNSEARVPLPEPLHSQFHRAEKHLVPLTDRKWVARAAALVAVRRAGVIMTVEPFAKALFEMMEKGIYNEEVENRMKGNVTHQAEPFIKEVVKKFKGAVKKAKKRKSHIKEKRVKKAKLMIERQILLSRMQEKREEMRATFLEQQKLKIKHVEDSNTEEIIKRKPNILLQHSVSTQPLHQPPAKLENEETELVEVYKSSPDSPLHSLRRYCFSGDFEAGMKEEWNEDASSLFKNEKKKYGAQKLEHEVEKKYELISKKKKIQRAHKLFEKSPMVQLAKYFKAKKEEYKVYSAISEAVHRFNTPQCHSAKKILDLNSEFIHKALFKEHHCKNGANTIIKPPHKNGPPPQNYHSKSSPSRLSPMLKSRPFPGILDAEKQTRSEIPKKLSVAVSPPCPCRTINHLIASPAIHKRSNLILTPPRPAFAGLTKEEIIEVRKAHRYAKTALLAASSSAIGSTSSKPITPSSAPARSRQVTPAQIKRLPPLVQSLLKPMYSSEPPSELIIAQEKTSTIRKLEFLRAQKKAEEKEKANKASYSHKSQNSKHRLSLITKKQESVWANFPPKYKQLSMRIGNSQSHMHAFDSPHANTISSDISAFPSKIDFDTLPAPFPETAKEFLNKRECLFTNEFVRCAPRTAATSKKPFAPINKPRAPPSVLVSGRVKSLSKNFLSKS